MNCSKSNPRSIERTRRLQLESLEIRRVLATFAPLPSYSDGEVGSLRATVVATQSNGQADTIELAAGLYQLNLGDLLINEVLVSDE